MPHNICSLCCHKLSQAAHGLSIRLSYRTNLAIEVYTFQFGPKRVESEFKNYRSPDSKTSRKASIFPRSELEDLQYICLYERLHISPCSCLSLHNHLQFCSLSTSNIPFLLVPSSLSDINTCHILPSQRRPTRPASHSHSATMLLKRAALLLFSLAQLALCAEDYYKVSSKHIHIPPVTTPSRSP